MSYAIKILIILFCIGNSTYVFAKSGVEHVYDMIEVSIGREKTNSQEIKLLLSEFTKTIDNFQIIKNLPLGQSGHRLYGHWGFSDSIPFNKPYLREMLQKIESNHGYEAAQTAKQKIIESWNKDVEKIKKIASNIIGYDGRLAKGYAGILYDIHLLGDYSGTKLSSLQAQAHIYEDLKKNIHRVFGNNSIRSKTICSELDIAYKKSINTYGKDSPKIAETILQTLKNSEQLKIGFANIANEKSILARNLKYSTGYVVPKSSNISGIEKTAKEIGVKNFRAHPGMILPSGKVIVPFHNGIYNGLLVFAVDSGISTYQFLKGEIYTPEYKKKIINAAINGATVGGVTAAIIFLGANPAGMTVLAVAAGTYIFVDKIQQKYNEYRNGKLLNRDDLEMLGIKIDSILEPNIDTSILLNIDAW